MCGLYRSDHTKFLEARHILRLAYFHVFNAITAIALSILFLNGFISIESLAYRAITAAMHSDLQAKFVTSACHAGEVLQGKQRLDNNVRIIGIRVDVERCERLPNAIHEEFDSTSAHELPLDFCHLYSFFQVRFNRLRLDLERNIHPEI